MKEDNIDYDKAIEYRAQMIANDKMRDQQLHDIADAIKILPETLADLRQAIELVDRNNYTRDNELRDKLSEILNNITTLNFKLVDRNNENSLINSIKSMFSENRIALSDANNPQSLMSIMQDSLDTLKDEIKESNSTRTFIIGLISAIGTIAAAIILILQFVQH